ncbi:unnamed protein product [Closterium sp. Yama58-4]|nr:unnamed protein product [Closterium sp. Yama58-4]
MAGMSCTVAKKAIVSIVGVLLGEEGLTYYDAKCTVNAQRAMSDHVRIRTHEQGDSTERLMGMKKKVHIIFFTGHMLGDNYGFVYSGSPYIGNKEQRALLDELIRQQKVVNARNRAAAAGSSRGSMEERQGVHPAATHEQGPSPFTRAFMEVGKLKVRVQALKEKLEVSKRKRRVSDMEVWLVGR